ncbi:MAG TPA: hypothetical protein PKU70_09425 [Vicinamibacteria bacterium]|nr:hypothetical protein [Vicinamibacteria bacterium]HRB13220.1 hypothetical protein [Vicinamibacteria bacterium]
MRSLSILGLAGVLLLSPLEAKAQEELSSVATLQLADGTSVALVQWKLTYEFVSWRSKEPVSTAKPQVRENPLLILGKKTYPVKGDSLTLKHLEGDDTVRVVSMSLKKAGALKVENPARDVLAPDLDKDRIYQPRSLDISGKTLSGMDRSFCLVSFSALVECGGTLTTRVVKIDFN